MRRFCELLRGCSWRDLIVLCDHNLLFGSVKIYYPQERSALAPVVGQIPWTIAWLTGRYHKKHLLTLGRSPNIGPMLAALRDFRERCKWRCLLGGSEMPSVRVRTRTPPACNMCKDMEYVGWANYFMRVVGAAATRGAGCFRQTRYHVDEPLNLIRRARDRLWRMQLVLVPQDKFPGLTLVHVGSLEQEHLAILGREWYSEVPPDTINYNAIVVHYRRLCGRVQDYEQKEGLAATLNKSLAQSSLMAVLKTTVKTHKVPGEVTMRNIHAVPRYPFIGLAKWAAARFREWNQRLPHLLSSTKVLHSVIPSLRLLPGDM